MLFGLLVFSVIVVLFMAYIITRALFDGNETIIKVPDSLASLARCSQCGIAFSALPGRSMADRDVCTKCHSDNLEGLLEEAFDALIWCSGNDDFQIEGKARKGWLKGPAVVLEKLHELHKARKKC